MKNVQILLLASIFTKTLAHYELTHDYTGASFFSGFNFFTDKDPTSGHVKFVSKNQANDTGLAGIMKSATTNSTVYLGVDSTTVADSGRASVRVESKESFSSGLILADILHMPGGVCGTWPAFWMVGAEAWPKGGEIDILEGINDDTSNSFTLHTLNSMPISPSNNTTPRSFTGEMKTPDCSVTAPNQPKNAGCKIDSKDNGTYGAGFNAQNGGTFATLITDTAIKIWFFHRNATPANIIAGNPQPDTKLWGTPRASFSGDFKIADHFRDLRIVFDTTFCGEWAGAVWPGSSCEKMAPTCEQYVSQNPKAFADMYWGINSVRVFQDKDAGMQNGTTTMGKVPRQPRMLRRVGGGVLLVGWNR